MAPEVLTPLPWLNRSLYCYVLLDLNTMASTFKDQDIKIYDAMQVLAILAINEEIIATNCNRLLLLNFVFEIVFGLDNAIPLQEKAWKVQFINKLQKYDLQYTISIAQDILLSPFTPELENFIELLSQKPSNELVSTYLSQINEQEEFDFPFFDVESDLEDEVEVEDEFNSEVEHIEGSDEESDGVGPNNEEVIFSNCILNSYRCEYSDRYNDLNDSALTSTIMTFASNSIMSQALLNRITDDGCIAGLIYAGIDSNFFELTKAAVRKISSERGYSQLKYIASRNAIDPFQGDQQHIFFEDEEEVLRILLSNMSPSLSHLDTFAQYVATLDPVRLLYKPTIYGDLVLRIFAHPVDYYFSILMGEAKSNIKIIIKNNLGIILSRFADFMWTKSKVVSLVERLVRGNRNPDPILLLFFSFSILSQAKSKIIDRFDLTKMYVFDIDVSKVRFGVHHTRVEDSAHLFKEVQGKTISFKDILDTFKLQKFMSLFTSTSTTSEFKVQTSNTRQNPVYLSHLFNDGI